MSKINFVFDYLLLLQQHLTQMRFFAIVSKNDFNLCFEQSFSEQLSLSKQVRQLSQVHKI
jgi:hypothetical protein